MEVSNGVKVLFITLSNIGDAVLTTPALSAILENFKDAEITLIVSPRAADIFKDDPHFKKIIIYRKDSPPGRKMALIKTLRGEDFDLLVDFKDTMLPFLLYAKKKTPIFKKPPAYIKSMKDRHLWKLRQALPGISEKEYKPLVIVPEQTVKTVAELLKANGISENDKIISVSPGARSHTKQWIKEGFLDACKRCVKELGVKVVLVGDQQDLRVCSVIMREAGPGVTDLCGKTGLKELAAILKRSSLLITNDSAPMHIAWAVNTPVVAVFGPTDYAKYGPRGAHDIIIRKELACSPCQAALCIKDNECLKDITPDEVFKAVRKIFTTRHCES